MTARRPTTILLVEDDPAHAILIRRNLMRAGIANDIVTLDDGQKAVDFLLKQGDYQDDPHPEPLLILLDLNLPVLNGCQVLKIIKHDDRTRQIPIVVLTTTDAPWEMAKCYDLGCNVYITKPVEYDLFMKAIQEIGLLLSVIKAPD